MLHITRSLDPPPLSRDLTMCPVHSLHAELHKAPQRLAVVAGVTHHRLIRRAIGGA